MHGVPTEMVVSLFSPFARAGDHEPAPREMPLPLSDLVRQPFAPPGPAGPPGRQPDRDGPGSPDSGCADPQHDVPGRRPCGYTWDDGFASLRAYLERERHSRIPSSYVDGAGLTLGLWAGRQRRAYQRGTLSADHARQLRNLRGWSWYQTWERGPGSAV